MKLVRKADVRTYERSYGTLELFAGCSAKGQTSRSADFKKISVRPGTSTSQHFHAARESIFHIVEGSLLCTTGESELRLQAGDTLVLDAGEDHIFHNDGPDLAVMLEIESPPHDSDDKILLTAELPRRSRELGRFWTEQNAVRLKICGVKSLDAAYQCYVHGVHAVGIHAVGDDWRSVLPSADWLRALPSALSVFLLTDLEDVRLLATLLDRLHCDTLQLQRDKAPDVIASIGKALRGAGYKVVKSFRVPEAKDLDATAALINRLTPSLDAVLLDSTWEGGSGRTANLDNLAGLVEALELPVIVAGGIDTSNVETILQALGRRKPDERPVRAARPFAVDVESSVEWKLIGHGKRWTVKDPRRIQALSQIVQAHRPASIPGEAASPGLDPLFDLDAPMGSVAEFNRRIARLTEVELEHRFQERHRGPHLKARIEHSIDQLASKGFDAEAALAIFASVIYIPHGKMSHCWKLACRNLMELVGVGEPNELLGKLALFQVEGESHIHDFVAANAIRGRREPELLQHYNSVNALEELRSSWYSARKLGPVARNELIKFLSKDTWAVLWDLNLSGTHMATEVRRLRRYASILRPQPTRIVVVNAICTREASRVLGAADTAELVCGLELPDTLEISSTACRLLTTDWLHRVRNLCAEVYDKLIRPCRREELVSYCEKNGEARGYKGRGLTLVTQANAPNNSLPPIWLNLPGPDGQYIGPFPRVHSQIVHASTAHRKIDTRTPQELASYMGHAQAYFFLEGCRLPWMDRPSLDARRMRSAYIGRLIGDLDSSSKEDRDEGQETVRRFAELAAMTPAHLENNGVHAFFMEYLDRVQEKLADKERHPSEIAEHIEALEKLSEFEGAMLDTYPSVKLALQAARIRSANDRGRFEPALEEGLRTLEAIVMGDRPELFVECRIVRAIHRTNGFDFQGARELLVDLSGQKRLDGISARQRAAFWSCLGQVEALLGQRGKARESFGLAANQVEAMVDGPARQREAEQIRTCEAINEMDDPEAAAHPAVASLLEEQVIRELACSKAGRYRHLLLLRYLFLRESSSRPWRETYLGCREQWSWDRDHPFHLIDMYRGIFLREEYPDEARRMFARAVEHALVQGETVQVIGCVVQAVANHLGSETGHGGRVSEALEKLRQRRIESLTARTRMVRDWLENPSSLTLVEGLERIIPFYFH